MPRPPRIDIQDGWHHVMNRGIDHGNVFLEDTDRIEFGQRLGSLYTRHVNDRLGRDGALFRGRFHSRLIVDDAHLVATVRYIHRNALDLPGVAHARDYRWSSHRSYLGLRALPPWLCTDHVFNGWAPAEVDRFVDEPIGSAPLPTQCDVDALIEAVELVLAERCATASSRSDRGSTDYIAGLTPDVIRRRGSCGG
jgi:hypothetical protein